MSQDRGEDGGHVLGPDTSRPGEDRFAGNGDAPDDGIIPIAQARARIRARFGGRIRRLAVHSMSSTPTFEIQVDDGTGRINALFLGRRAIGGMDCGRRVVIEGTPVAAARGLTIYNPEYELLG